MTSNLPSRWQEILRREAAAKVGTVLDQARSQPEPRRMPRWSVPVGVVAFGSFSLFNLLGDGEAKSRGSLPFDRSTVISTRTVGLGASAEDLAPAKRKPELPPVSPSAPLLTPPAPKPVAKRRPVETPPAPSTPAPRCLECEKRLRADAVAEQDATQEIVRVGPTPDGAPVQAAETRPPREPESPSVPAPGKPLPVVINIGTRLQAVLTDPVITGAAIAPATARLAADFYVGERLVIPAGTTLVGEGFATQQDERVQVVFSAFVKDGKTLQFEGWALQDSEMGIPGKLIRKGSTVKSGSGTVMGAAASALTFGLAGAARGPAGAALSSLGSTVGSDLNRLGRDWRLSDKAVRVEAGVPITVYVRRDLTIE